MPKTIITKIKNHPESFDKIPKKGKKKNKTKFKKISFKLTDFQQDALLNICRRQNTTPVRYLKLLIKKQTARYKNYPQPVSYATDNQLQLFELEPLPGRSLSKTQGGN